MEVLQKTVELSNRACLAVRVNYSAPQPERLVDEQDQTNHIPFGQPPHLTFRIMCTAS